VFGVVVGGGRSKGRGAQDAVMPAQDRPWWPWAGIGADYTRALRAGAVRALQRPERISKILSEVGLAERGSDGPVEQGRGAHGEEPADGEEEPLVPGERDTGTLPRIGG